MRFVAAVSSTFALLSLAAPASAQVTFLNYTVSPTDARVGFQRIGVTRGTSSFAYWDTEIILPSLNRINGVPNVTVLTPDGPTKNADAFLRDLYLNTGLGSNLSSMGLAAGESVSLLYLQDWSGYGNSVFPTLIAGLPPIQQPGDANYDGLVDGADYTIWADSYAPDNALSSAVTEPSAFVLAGIGALALLARGTARLRARDWSNC